VHILRCVDCTHKIEKYTSAPQHLALIQNKILSENKKTKP
jgi:hypothetical protein